jgi:hypothetical protein
MNKVRKALDSGGPSFIELLAPCPKGWFFDPKDTIDLAKLALETRAWASWEYVKGRFSLTYRPRKITPIREYLRIQGRFSHLTDEEIEEIQKMTDAEWKYWEEMDKQKRIVLPWISAPNLVRGVGICPSMLGGNLIGSTHKRLKHPKGLYDALQ